MCQGRIAGTQNYVAAKIYAEFFFQFLLNVDFTEHTESFFPEYNRGSFYGHFVRNIKHTTESVN